MVETRYAKSGDVNVAYQVAGEGPVDVVFVPGWVSHVEHGWDEPSYAPFLERIMRFSRLILFDRPGTGLSDPVDSLPTLEQRMDTVRAVMDAAGSEKAVRVCGLASANETVVSSTVRDLVAGSGLRFTDRGLHTLKGVPSEWRLYAAEM